MKKQTAELLVKYAHEGKVEYGSGSDGFSVDYTLSDEELTEIVESEYGSTSQDLHKLFEAILTKALKLAINHGKELDKLSEL